LTFFDWKTDETDLSTEQARPQAPSRLPRPSPDQERPQGAGPSPLEGPQAAFGLTPGVSGPRLSILKKREDFLASRGGPAAPTPCFLLALSPGANGYSHPRIGFTVTKKLGGAVVRNRIRRRLKAAAAEAFPGSAMPGRDYVVIARAAAETRAYALLLDDMKRALLRLSRDAI
jgi:ribonuclease P protein component